MVTTFDTAQMVFIESITLDCLEVSVNYTPNRWSNTIEMYVANALTTPPAHQTMLLQPYAIKMMMMSNE